MAEVLEIIAGATLLAVYLVLTMWLPVAMIGLVFVLAALVIRFLLGLIGSVARVVLAPVNRALGVLPAPWPGVVKGIVQKALLVIVWLLAFGSVGLFFRWTQGFTKVWEDFNRGEWADATSTILGDSVRLIVLYLERVQDESLRFFAGRTLAEFLAESTDVGPGALAHFFRLVANRFHTLIQPTTVKQEDFQWLAAAFVVSVLLALLMMGVPRLKRKEAPSQAFNAYWETPTVEPSASGGPAPVTSTEVPVQTPMPVTPAAQPLAASPPSTAPAQDGQGGLTETSTRA